MPSAKATFGLTRSRNRFIANAAVVLLAVCGLAVWSFGGSSAQGSALSAVHLPPHDQALNGGHTPEQHAGAHERLLGSGSETCGQRIAEKYNCE